MVFLGSVRSLAFLLVGTSFLGTISTSDTSQQLSLAVHTIPTDQLVSVIVKRKVESGKKNDKPKYVLVNTAPGFSVKGCDALTIFDAVRTYEDDKARGVNEMIEVVVGKDHYDADLRFLGVYPLGYNLACVQIQRNGSGSPHLHVFSLEKNEAYDGLPSEKDVSKHVPLGTPFEDAAGNVVAVLTPRPEDLSGRGVLVTAKQIQSFLDALADESPHGVPHLNHRPLIPKPPAHPAAFIFKNICYNNPSSTIPIKKR